MTETFKYDLPNFRVTIETDLSKKINLLDATRLIEDDFVTRSLKRKGLQRDAAEMLGMKRERMLMRVRKRKL